MRSLHHAAYDANLLGIDPDGGIHVNESLLRIHDGPTLEYALKGVHGTRLRSPRASTDRPSRESSPPATNSSSTPPDEEEDWPTLMSTDAPTLRTKLGFLQNVQGLLEEGMFTATYKFALLLALADLCVERGQDTDSALRVETS